VKAKNVDLSKLDFVVMSHRHGDHMGTTLALGSTPRSMEPWMRMI